LFYKVIFFLVNLFPNIKKYCWKLWYNFISNKFKDDYFKFMNYGYYNEELVLALDKSDELERYPIQLYHHLCIQVELKDKVIVEVGSGRGGGAHFIARYHKPKVITGVDLSPNAVSLSNKSYNLDNLNFLVGDSAKLPFENNSVDVILNVESSHCYPSIPDFISEVCRVLKPGGHFLYCDLVIDSNLDDHLNKLKNNNLPHFDYIDITENIIIASELMTNDRNNIIDKVGSGFLRKVLKSFASVKGSKIYKSFVDRHYRYISLVTQKK
jgi:ubiquinone/menaquinone biosynthesis C-methylase UbiE